MMDNRGASFSISIEIYFATVPILAFASPANSITPPIIRQKAKAR